MHRRQILDQLRSARAAHLQWRSQAQALVEGGGVDLAPPPRSHKQCRFGLWYEDARSALGGLPAFRVIERPHAAVHDRYHQIYTLMHTHDSAVSRYLGLSKRLKSDRRSEASRALAQMLTASEALLNALDSLEHEVKAITEIELIALEPS